MKRKIIGGNEEPGNCKSRGLQRPIKALLCTLLNAGSRVLKNTESNKVNQNPGAQRAPGSVSQTH